MARNVKLSSMFGRILTGGAVVVAGAVIVSAAQVGVEPTLRALPPMALLVFLTWAAFWRPAVLVTDDEVVVRNVFSTDRVPFTHIASIDTRYALTLQTLQGKVTAWAAPAPSRHATFNAVRADGGFLPESTYLDGTVRPGDLATSDSGAAAAVIRRRWEEIREDQGTIGTGPAQPRQRTWHMATIAVASVLLVVSVIALNV